MAPTPSLSRGLQAANSLDGFAGLRAGLKAVADRDSLWAGIPMPLDGERLVIEPSFPNAERLSKIGQKPAEAHELDGWTKVNEWYSAHHRRHIVVMRKPDGETTWGWLPAFHHASHDLHTLGCSDAWGLEQEQRALQLLGTLIRHRQMKQYVLTGMFLETSRRSGIAYLFRRLKPTVAISMRTGTLRILACLCMHPIAYYAGTWAGGMCPTDDVIAHLSLMRGDEHMFWKRSTQHPPYLPEAGL